MKGLFTAAAVAAMASGANAHNNAHRRAHDLFKRTTPEACVPGCTTYVRTIYGEATCTQHSRLALDLGDSRLAGPHEISVADQS